MRSQAAAGYSDNLSDETYMPRNDTSEGEQEEITIEQFEDAQTLLQFRQCLTDSTHHLETNYRKQFERNIAHFQSKHPSGSKYFSETYKYRSKLHLPKIRAVATRWLAAVSQAFFSNREIAVVEAENQNDKVQAAAADLWKQALQYRLTKKMPWYKTVLGAGQDAFVNGVCISHQYWKYEEDADGDVIHDTLACDLIPVENIRFSPAADWRDPLNDSEYLIHIMPMTVNKVKMKMMSGEWAPIAESVIRAATRPYDPTHQARQDGAQDPNVADTVPGHVVAYVYKCIMRENGIDYIYYVLGTDHLLTTPTKLKDINPRGLGRNYTMGSVDIEAHRAIGQSSVEQLESVLNSINDTVNTRKDNVALAINKRWKIRRGRKVDIASLMRNVPGGAIMVQDHTDVEEFENKDVTASAYKEQEYDSSMFDEIAGSFNQGSINTNRRIGETAAGMELLASDANVVTEFKLEVFVQWLQATLEQLLLLEQAYETDFTVMTMAADAAEIIERHGIDQLTTDMVEQNLMLSVNVGVDATNPARALDKIMALVNLGASLGSPIDPEEIFKEAAGRSGYDNGSRFLISPEKQAEMQQQGPSPEEQAAQAQVQTEQMKLEQAGMKLESDKMKVESDQMRMQIEAQKAQLAAQKQESDANLAIAKLEAEMDYKERDLAVRREIAEESTEAQLGIAVMQDKTVRETAALQAETNVQNKLLDREVALSAQAEQREANQRRDEITRESNKSRDSVTREANHLKDKQVKDAVKSKSDESTGNDES